MHKPTAIENFLQETIRFLSAQKYLITVHISALKRTDSVAKAHAELSEDITPPYNDPHAYFIARLFIAHVAAFEIFLQETIMSVIIKHPKKVGNTQFKLSDIIEAGGTNRLIERAAEDFLNKLMYKKPQEYLDDVCSILSIDRTPLVSYWGVFIEAKSRRDLGVHNGWKCNQIYLRKIREAGLRPILSVGESAIPQDEAYLNDVISGLKELAILVAKEVRSKHES